MIKACMLLSSKPESEKTGYAQKRKKKKEKKNHLDAIDVKIMSIPSETEIEMFATKRVEDVKRL
jgi:hypothetical protein